MNDILVDPATRVESSRAPAIPAYLGEPYAKGLWRKEILQFSSAPDEFVWCKETCFGGLYGKIVAQRR